MPRFPLPPQPDLPVASVLIEDAKIATEFDELLAEMVVRRVLIYYPNESKMLKHAATAVLPQIRERVDAELISCMCAQDPLYNHNVVILKSSPYKREDKIQFRVRKLVEMVYPGAHKEFIRQKTTGCMLTIQSVAASLVIRVV